MKALSIFRRVLSSRGKRVIILCVDNKTLNAIRQEVKKARLILFLGGAGVSTASGIPDFRSPQGLYNIKSKYGVPYETMLSHDYFMRHTETFYQFYWESMVNKNAKPCKAHLSLAEFEKRTHRLCVVTQNIDGLHQLAGSKNVLEAHGSVWRYTCLGCGEHYSLDDIEAHGVPHCPHCGDILKPDVTLYGEMLDEEVLEKAVMAARTASLLIIGGTSMQVYPIAALPDYFGNGPRIIINKEATPYDRYCDYVIHEDLGEVLSLILGE